MNDMKIAVVGGGTAGFVSALILKTTYPNYQVDIIRSEKIGTIGVGEGTTEHWSVFMDHVGIQTAQLINECDATFKTGIMFEDWGDKPYLQSVHSPFVFEHLGLPAAFAKLIGEQCNPRDMTGDYLWNNNVPFNKFIDERPNDTGVSQYHFNTQKLNNFLTKFAIEKGCNVFDDEIVDVAVNTQGIDYITSKTKTYNYDFYIDCTGFSRLLIGKLGATWNSYSDHLLMKEAIVFPTPQEEETPLWTLAKAMDAGWMFRIPVQGRKGNGYIFDSNFITAEQAQIEVEKYLGYSIDVAKHIKFDPGAVDRPWIKNVCAIGLSASFVEPLEASSIGTSINQAFLLARRMINYNEQSINRYNIEVNAIMENVRDFIALHYVSNRRDTPFWNKVASTPLPHTLQENLKMWKTRLPIADDFTSYTKKVLFNEYNVALVMHGLDLFDTDSILTQYNMLPDEVLMQIDEICKHKINFDRSKTIPHKLMLELLRHLV
tara:strand:+ start:703 stop:2166 length:1464 start_codon:yes stop_codon:yes gene_type:complete